MYLLESSREMAARLHGVTPISDPGIPFVTTVLPIAALAAGNIGKTVGNFDVMDILGLLVAKLALDPEPERRAMGHIQRLAVHCISNDGLGMKAVAQVD